MDEYRRGQNKPLLSKNFPSSNKRSKKRGPRDHYNGLTLKILKYASEVRIFTTRMIAERFGITPRCARYHINKLMELGYIRRIGHRNSPYCCYVFAVAMTCHGRHRSGAGPCHNGARGFTFVKWGIILDRLGRVSAGARQVYMYVLSRGSCSSRMVSIALGRSVRWVEKELRELVDANLVVRCGGEHCCCQVYVVNPNPDGPRLVHKHKGHVRHRYRLRRLKGWLARVEFWAKLFNGGGDGALS